MPFSLRLATNADMEGIAQVSLATGQPPSDSGADGRYVALLLGHGAVAVACSCEEQIIGWAATRPTPLGDMLSDLFVDPRHQGQGIGAALLAHLWPDRAGRSARFAFSSRHASAMPLYAKAGLRPTWPLLYLSGEPRRLGHDSARRPSDRLGLLPRPGMSASINRVHREVRDPARGPGPGHMAFPVAGRVRARGLRGLVAASEAPRARTEAGA